MLPSRPLSTTPKLHKAIASYILLSLQFLGKKTEAQSSDITCQMRSPYQCVAGTQSLPSPLQRLSLR